MALPEDLDLITAVERCLSCSTADAVEVLDRASRDPPWARRDDLELFEELARRHYRALLADRGRGGP